MRKELIVAIAGAVAGAVVGAASSAIIDRVSIGAVANKGTNPGVVVNFQVGRQILAEGRHDENIHIITDKRPCDERIAAPAPPKAESANKRSQPVASPDPQPTPTPSAAPSSDELAQLPPPSPAAQLVTELNNSDADERAQAARRALSTNDEAYRAMAVRKVYAHGDPALRQIAVIWLLEQALKHALPINFDVETKDGAPPSQQAQETLASLRGSSLLLSNMDRVSGRFLTSLFKGWWNGNVSHSGILMTGTLNRVGATMVLHAVDAFELQGQLEAGSQVFRVSIPLL